MISYVLDVLIIILLFFVFGYTHSLFASNKFKRLFIPKLGNKIAFYRLGYNIISLFILYFFYEISPKPDIVIYDLPSPYGIIILIPQFLSLAGLLWCFKYFSGKEFLGIKQIERYSNGDYHADELDEKLTLKISGPYKFSRHPVYLFSILFLLFRPIMDLFYITVFICAVAYFYIGSIYEERKLIENFGEIYREYQNQVPRIFPTKLFQPYQDNLAASE